MSSQKLIVGLKTWQDFDHLEGQKFLELVKAGAFGGVILFADNCHSPSQVKSLTGILKEAAGDRPFWISIDEEGGLVTRLNESFDLRIPTAKDLGAFQNPKTYTGFTTQAQILQDLGINLNFSPVVDLALGSPVVEKKGRSFGANPDHIIGWAQSFLKQSLEKGVMGCLKHFPGHGALSVDTHDCVAYADDLEIQALKPFQKLHKAFPQVPIMLAHVVIQKFDDQVSCLSPKWRAVIHQALSPKACVITDDLSMGALQNVPDPKKRLKLALQGPADFLIFSQNPKASLSHKFKMLTYEEMIEICDLTDTRPV